MFVRSLYIPIAAVALVLVASMMVGAPVPAQERYLTARGQASVSVVEDNLVSAKQLALSFAQRNALMQAIGSLLAPFWLEQYRTIIQKDILSQRQQYIVSFHANVLEPTRDHTRYRAQVEIQADRIQLESALRNLSLPLLSQPLQQLQPIFAKDDPIFQQQAFRDGLLQRLSQRLELFRFQLETPRTLSRRQMQAALSAKSNGDRKRILARQLRKPVLLLFFSSPQRKQPAQLSLLLLAERSAVIIAELHIQADDPLFTNFEDASLAQQDMFFLKLVNPLVTVLLPEKVQIHPKQFTVGQQYPLQLIVSGLESIGDEETFSRLFFSKGSLFEGFGLSRITTNSIIFSGGYGGLQEDLPVRLRNRTFGPFAVQQVQLVNGNLVLQVRRHRTGYHRSPTFSGNQIGREVESNGWFDSANRLPLKVTLKGKLDARADSDFFIGRAIAGNPLKIIWQREGRSRLEPVLRIYDQKRNLLLERYLNSTTVEFTPRLPAGSGEFYLELADRFGHVPGEVGGYLKLSYQLRVF